MISATEASKMTIMAEAAKETEQRNLLEKELKKRLEYHKKDSSMTDWEHRITENAKARYTAAVRDFRSSLSSYISNSVRDIESKYQEAKWFDEKIDNFINEYEKYNNECIKEFKANGFKVLVEDYQFSYYGYKRTTQGKIKVSWEEN